MRYRLAWTLFSCRWQSSLFRKSPPFPTIVLAVVIASCSSAVQNAPAQAASGNGEPAASVVLTKLAPPVYPPLARQADRWRCEGEGLDQDGREC